MEKTMQYSASAESDEGQNDGNNGHGEGNEHYSGGNGHDTRDYSRKSGSFSLKGLEQKVLTREEERDMFKRLGRAKTKEERLSCRSEIARYNLRLVISIANYYSFFCSMSDLEIGELVDAGVIGLIESIDRHEYGRGLKLSTHAVEHIQRYVKRTFDNESSLIRIPVGMRERVYNVKRAEEDLFYKLKREPTIKEIAKEARMKLSSVKNAKEFMNSHMPKQPVSLNTPVNGNGNEEIFLVDAVSGNYTKNHDSVYEKARGFVLREKLAESIKELEDREKQVLYSRFGLDGNGCKTLDETGRSIGISRERVRQIEARAIGKLKKKISLKLMMGEAIVA